MKKLLFIILSALWLASCSKDKAPPFDCESCTFGIQLINGKGDTLTKYFEHKDIWWAYGIPADVNDYCLYFDTTQSAKKDLFYIGRVCK
jgi:hypothetical protein